MAERISLMASRFQLRYLLLGCTGKGKSATGNSILGHYGFETGSNVTSETILVKTEWATQDVLDVQVIDGPGLMDTRFEYDRVLENELFIANLDLALFLCQDGFHAVLIMLKYGDRLTSQELQTIEMIKSILGIDAIKKYGILVFTHGDNYARQFTLHDNSVSEHFKTYMNEQRRVSDYIRNLLDLIDNRFIIFDNSGDTSNERKLSQRYELFKMTINLNKKNKSKRFDCKLFEKARLRRKELTLKTKEEMCKLETEKELSMVLSCLVGINKKLDDNNDVSDRIKIFNDVKRRLLNRLKFNKSSDEYMIKMESILLGADDCLRQLNEERYNENVKNQLKEIENTMKTERENARIILAKTKDKLVKDKNYQETKSKVGYYLILAGTVAVAIGAVVVTGGVALVAAEVAVASAIIDGLALGGMMAEAAGASAVIGGSLSASDGDSKSEVLSNEIEETERKIKLMKP